MSLYNQVKSQYPQAEQKIIESFWAAYHKALAKTRENPNSIAAQAKILGISRQALDERLRRAANPKPKGRPKKNKENP